MLGPHLMYEANIQGLKDNDNLDKSLQLSAKHSLRTLYWKPAVSEDFLLL